MTRRYDPYACLGKRTKAHAWGPYGLDVSDYPDRKKPSDENREERAK